MEISFARVWNNKGFLDSGELYFGSGFNLLVGKNGAGKTVLLNALGQRSQGDPHRSIASIPEVDGIPNQTTRIEVHHKISGTELKSLWLAMNARHLMIPTPRGYDERHTEWNAFLGQIFARDSLELRMFWEAAPDVGFGPREPVEPTFPEYPWVRDPNNPSALRSLSYSLMEDRKNYLFQSIGLASPAHDSYFSVAAHCRERVYRFDAERLRRGRGPFGTSRALAADASNLPEVLHNLQAERDAYAEFLELVRKVLPDVRDVLVVPLGSSEQEIRVSSLPSTARRKDLSVPLLKTGSGVAQVLALIYVVLSASTPQVILVDEPNSFLHPQASRSLMKIFKQFERHQYIIATHSPEVIAELGAVATTVLEWKENQSKATQYKVGDSQMAGRALDSVGARLSDVFGFDRVVWCEGPSDASCLRLVAEKLLSELSGTAIVPVHSTGSFEKARIEETIDVYKQLSSASALIPPAVGFLFDAEDRTEGQRADAVRRRDVRIRFLNRRMIENYLLDETAILDMLQTIAGDLVGELSAVKISKWLEENTASPKYAFREITPERLRENPVVLTHGKRLLNDLVTHFTDGAHTFINTRDVPVLTKAVLERDVRLLADLAGELRAMVVDF